MELPSYFRQYLHAIQPTPETRARAIQLHTTLCERLARDEDFSDWFEDTFLYGSYRRNTAVQPIKDVDVCVLLKIKPPDHKPEAVVQRLRRVLERNGYKDKTGIQRRSVRIDMSGTTLDVVPVVAVNGADQPLWIPDRKLARWVDTHPKGHLASAKRLNKESNGRFIPFVKIVKSWYCYQLRDVDRPKPKGFTLEALVSAYQDADAPTYAEAFVNFIENLWRSCGWSLQNGVFPAVSDPGMPGQSLKLSFSEDEVKRFSNVVQDSLAKAKCALSSEDLSESASAWRDILGPKFPIPSAETARMATKSLTESDTDDSQDEDISEIELPQAPTLGLLNIKAGLAMTKGGPLTQYYPSGSRALGRGLWLYFTIDRTSVPEPYSVRWIVENHGREARDANDLGPRLDGDGVSRAQWESTKYRGSHTMICELHRNGVVLARARHTVNIRGS